MFELKVRASEEHGHIGHRQTHLEVESTHMLKQVFLDLDCQSLALSVESSEVYVGEY